MRYNDEDPRPNDGTTAESELTTEDLARPAAAEEREAPLYPGEATPGGTADEDAGPEPAATASQEPADEEQPLLGAADTERYRSQWSEIQGRFVDDPKDAVKSADTLVAEVMQTLAGTFSTHKQDLEGQWGRGEEVATEDLRVALQRYRSFFNRLLKT
ncbi:hypothetical protein ACFWUZ_11935 [Streptomyces sp. NPDC058646]|uniref:hypothetical protein n=1 Tax=Streptomyces sp. NPDC058646 TaxID=3346574 RepID=UPI0036649464